MLGITGRHAKSFSNLRGLRLAEGLIVQMRKLHLEDAAPYRMLAGKTGFIFCECERMYGTYAPTGFLCTPQVTLASVRTKFHAKVRAARCSSLPACVG